jgi:hypothetical protein
MAGKHEVIEWREQGWCERCKVDACRPVREVKTPLGKGISEWRYMCDFCVEEWLCRPFSLRPVQRGQEIPGARQENGELVAA